MKKILLFVLWVGLFGTLMGQKEMVSLIRILPTFSGEPLRLDHLYAFQDDSLEISKLRFYISAISLWEAGEQVWAEANSYHLMDMAEYGGLYLPIKMGVAFDEVRFRLGIDSLTNVSGAMGGDLDPTKGMYWTWQTGYINFKLEGKSPLAGSQNQAFIYHLGGYMPPYQTVQEIQLACQAREEIVIEFELSPFFQVVDLSVQPHLMSPGAQSAQLSVLAASLFKIKSHE